jgi:methylaspartate mutase sigma subunit
MSAAMSEVQQVRGTAVISGLASDAHTWNLVFLQLLLEELGYAVVNLGPCVPDELLVAECARVQPTLLVLSSVNGHGGQDALRVITRLRAHPDLATLPAVVGGQLGVTDNDDAQAAQLIAAGFDAVFPGGYNKLASFCRFVSAIGLAAAA